MRIVLGILVILGTIALALYVGLDLMFVGGIVQIVHGAQADPVGVASIAWGVIRVFFASFVGTFLAYLGVAAGIGICMSGDD